MFSLRPPAEYPPIESNLNVPTFCASPKGLSLLSLPISRSLIFVPTTAPAEQDMVLDHTACSAMQVPDEAVPDKRSDRTYPYHGHLKLHVSGLLFFA